MRAIVGQQLSVIAARAIDGRLRARFGGRPPTPEEVLADDPDALRTAVGLSRAKVAYLRSLAEHVRAGELELDRLDALDDDAIVAELVAVKGIGTWTAQVFLLAQLGRPDVVVPRRPRDPQRGAARLRARRPAEPGGGGAAGRAVAPVPQPRLPRCCGGRSTTSP